MKFVGILTAVATVAAIAMPEMASAFVVDVGNCGQQKCDTVPEIDALAGFAAIGAVGAVVALIRERTKR